MIHRRFPRRVWTNSAVVVALAAFLWPSLIPVLRTEASAADNETPTTEKPAQQAQETRESWRAFGRVTDGDGRPLAGVEVGAHCGLGTLPRTGVATSGEDGRYELNFHPAYRGKGVALQAATISAHKAGYFEENLNRQGRCTGANSMPDERDMKRWGADKERLFLPDRPLEIDFVMRPAGKVAGKVVDEQGRPLVRYYVSLTGADLPPSASVVCDGYTDEQGRFNLDDVPTSYRFQFVVRKADPKPPWNDSWASAALRFDRPEQDNLRAWFGKREIRAAQLVLRVAGPGVHGRTATRIAGNVGVLHLTVDNDAEVTEQSETRLAAKSAVLTLRNTAGDGRDASLITDSIPAEPAEEMSTRMRRGRPNEAGEFVVSFQNPRNFDLTRGKHQVIFQVFVGVSQKPIREKIFRQLEIENGRYEVPVKIPPELIDDSSVSVTFVTIQPDHEAWVKAFFLDGKGTSYRGIWTSDGDLLPAIPLAAADRD